MRVAYPAAELEQLQVEQRHHFMYGAKKGFTAPIHALRGYKSGYSETRRENAHVAYTFDFLTFSGAAKSIRTPDPRITNS
jgi:hypothetical protein